MGATVFVFYLLTLAPTVLYYAPENYDSAHLQVVANVLGIPSYTGYPTYVMLAHLFTYLPVGDAAYRVNLASAAFAALAVAILYFLCRRVGAGKVGAVAGSLAFGLSVTFWSQAVISEVYTLHVLLTTLFLLALILWSRNREERYLLLAALTGGVAMTNHLTSVFLLPAALVFVALVEARALLRPKLWLKTVGLFLLGLTPYLYLPLRAAMDPPLVGAGPAGDPSTPGGFLDLVSGGEHKARIFAFGPAELPGRIGVYAGHLLDNLNPALLALVLVGAVVLFKRDLASLVLLGLVFVLNLGYALEYDIEDLEIYFIPTYLMLCIVLAVGVDFILRRARGRYVGGFSAAPLVASLVAALALVAVIVSVPGSYSQADRSEDYKGREIVEAVANGTKPGSTVLYHGRSLHYMQLVEGRREDLKLVDPFYTADWVKRTESNLARGPVYVLYPGATNTRLYKEAGYDLEPVEEGMLYEVKRRR
ncbi:MAG: DUF2723 domain-containing protein [Rubrobacteraceae bacterium]